MRQAPPGTRFAALAVVALIAAAVAAPSANAAPAAYAGSSADGSIVFFTTTEKLVPGDTDNRLDVYERSLDNTLGTYVTREVSTGPTGGNDAYNATFDGASADGTKVFFSTSESLVPEDTDRSSDIYMRDLTTGTTTLISQGAASCAPGCGNGSADASFAGATPDGSKVFFVTDEQLSSADTDSSLDIYMRDLTTGTTTLVSQGAASCAQAGCGNGPLPAVFQGASADGNKVFFTTTEALSTDDTDSNLVDIYMRDLTNGTTTLVSRPWTPSGTCPSGLDCNAVWGGASSDGSHVFFETNERISAADIDNSSDVYDWSGGTATLVSTGPSGGNGFSAATFAGASADGKEVFFETSESLVPVDTDNAQDIYMRSGGVTTLVSTGATGGNGAFPASFDEASPDGSKVIFNTAEQLTSADTDTAQDVYMRDLTAGTTTLESTSPTAGNGAFDASFVGASSDGSHVFFKTAEPMVPLPQDTDASPDIYERVGAATNLISTGPLGGNGAFDSNLTGVSQDGAHAFFITDERLTVDDLDTETDVYDYSAAGTMLVSVGNSVQLGPPTPSLTGTNPASPGSSTTPAINGQEGDQASSIKIYTTLDCSGVPVATGTAQQLTGAGIPVTVAVGSTTTFWATATNTSGDTSACSTDAATYQQMNAPPPPPPPPPPGGGGSGPPPAAPSLSRTDPAGPANMNQPHVIGSAAAGATVKLYATKDCSGAPLATGSAAELASLGIQVSVPDNSTTGFRATATVGAAVSACSAPVTYVEDSTPPQTRITYAPGVKTRIRHPIFRFTDTTDETGTSFLCRLDRQPWRPCSPPQRLKRLKRGMHTFRVEATDAAGNQEPRAVKRSFRLVSG